MSWEARFSNIVQETERNMTNLQKRLASYSYPVPPCPLFEEKMAMHDLPCPKSGCCPIPSCNPCVIPPPCSPYPLYPDHNQEISVLKRHIKDLEIDNEVQKRIVAQQQQQQNRDSRGEAESEKASAPPQHPHPCTAAVAVRDLFQQWQIDVNQQISALQTQIACQKSHMANISPTVKDFDVIKKEMAELRQFMNVEISVAHEELNMVKAKLETTKCNMDAIEAQMLADVHQTTLASSPANAHRDRYVPRAPHNTFSEEMKSTVDTLREQIGLLEDHLRNKKYKENEMDKLNSRIASAFSDSPAPAELAYQRAYPKQDTSCMPNVDYQCTVSTTSTRISQRQTSISSAHSTRTTSSPVPVTNAYNAAGTDDKIPQSEDDRHSPQTADSPSLIDAERCEMVTPSSPKSPESGKSNTSIRSHISIHSNTSIQSHVSIQSRSSVRTAVSFRSPLSDRASLSDRGSVDNLSDHNPVSDHSSPVPKSPVSIHDEMRAVSPVSHVSPTSSHHTRSPSPVSNHSHESDRKPDSICSHQSTHSRTSNVVCVLTSSRSPSPDVVKTHYYTHDISTADYKCKITTTSSKISLHTSKTIVSSQPPSLVIAPNNQDVSPYYSRSVSPSVWSQGYGDDTCIHIERSVSDSKSLLVAINLHTIPASGSLEHISDKPANKAIECTPVENDMKEVVKHESKASFCDLIVDELVMDVTVVMEPQQSSKIPSTTQITTCDSLTTFEADVLKHLEPEDIEKKAEHTPESLSVVVDVSPIPLSPPHAVEEKSNIESSTIECAGTTVVKDPNNGVKKENRKESHCDESELERRSPGPTLLYETKVYIEAVATESDASIHTTHTEGLGTDIDNLFGNVDIGIEYIGGNKEEYAIEEVEENLETHTDQRTIIIDRSETSVATHISVSIGSTVVDITSASAYDTDKQADINIVTAMQPEASKQHAAITSATMAEVDLQTDFDESTGVGSDTAEVKRDFNRYSDTSDGDKQTDSQALSKVGKHVTIEASSGSDKTTERGRTRQRRGTDVDCRHGDVDIGVIVPRGSALLSPRSSATSGSPRESPSRSASRSPGRSASRSSGRSPSSNTSATRDASSELCPTIDISVVSSPIESDVGSEYMVDVIIENVQNDISGVVKVVEYTSPVVDTCRDSGTSVDIANGSPGHVIKDMGSPVDSRRSSVTRATKEVDGSAQGPSAQLDEVKTHARQPPVQEHELLPPISTIVSVKSPPLYIERQSLKDTNYRCTQSTPDMDSSVNDGGSQILKLPKIEEPRRASAPATTSKHVRQPSPRDTEGMHSVEVSKYVRQGSPVDPERWQPATTAKYDRQGSPVDPERMHPVTTSTYVGHGSPVDPERMQSATTSIHVTQGSPVDPERWQPATTAKYDRQGSPVDPERWQPATTAKYDRQGSPVDPERWQPATTSIYVRQESPVDPERWQLATTSKYDRQESPVDPEKWKPATRSKYARQGSPVDPERWKPATASKAIRQGSPVDPERMQSATTSIHVRQESPVDPERIQSPTTSIYVRHALPVDSESTQTDGSKSDRVRQSKYDSNRDLARQGTDVDCGDGNVDASTEHAAHSRSQFSQRSITCHLRDDQGTSIDKCDSRSSGTITNKNATMEIATVQTSCATQHTITTHGNSKQFDIVMPIYAESPDSQPSQSSHRQEVKRGESYVPQSHESQQSSAMTYTDISINISGDDFSDESFTEQLSQTLIETDNIETSTYSSKFSPSYDVDIESDSTTDNEGELTTDWEETETIGGTRASSRLSSEVGTDLDRLVASGVGTSVDEGVAERNTVKGTNVDMAYFGTNIDNGASATEASVSNTTELWPSEQLTSDTNNPIDIEFSLSNVGTDIDSVEGYVDMPILFHTDNRTNSSQSGVVITRYIADPIDIDLYNEVAMPHIDMIGDTSSDTILASPRFLFQDKVTSVGETGADLVAQPVKDSQPDTPNEQSDTPDVPAGQHVPGGTTTDSGEELL